MLDKLLAKLTCSKLGLCHRRVVYEVNDETEFIGTSRNRMFQDGQIHEFLIKYEMVYEDGVEMVSGWNTEPLVVFMIGMHRVPGHMDGIISVTKDTKPLLFNFLDSQYVTTNPIEVKSMGHDRFKLMEKSGPKAFPEIYAQMQAYMDSELISYLPSNIRRDSTMVGDLYDTYAPYERVFDKNIKLGDMVAIAKSRQSGEVLIDIVKKNDEYIEKLKDDWLQTFIEVGNGDLPPRPYQRPAKECYTCRFRTVCWRK